MQDWKRLVLTTAAGAALTASLHGGPLEAQGRGRSDRENSPRVFPGRSIPRGYEEPAFARGYNAGQERGRADARRGQRYDPVASREYRDGDRGYSAPYGSRDAYKSNYRAGFRQGYEDGYRNH
jgi:hypothetical protein